MKMLKSYKLWTFYFGGIILMSHFYATTQSSSEDHQITIPFPYFSSEAIPEHSISVSFKNNEIDTSSFVEAINQLRESDYADDLMVMKSRIDQMSDLDSGFSILCEKSVSKNICMENAQNSLENAFYKVAQEKENQILYPEFYTGIYGRPPDRYMLQDAHEILDSECQGPYDADKLSNRILRIHPNHWPELQDKLKYKDKGFLKQVLQTTYDQLKRTTYPEQCFDLANKNHRVCKRMTNDLKVKRHRFTYLTELVYGQNILQTTEAVAPCLDCVEGLLSKELSDLNQLFSVLEKHSLCFDPTPGEEKQVINNRDTYTVRRERDGSFSIPLNLNFVADEDYDGEIPRAEVPTHYKNKVQECMKKASSKLLGPNGEKLKIVIESPPAESACALESAKTIRIGPSNFRSYSSKYKANIDCPTITHEVLHLLGLCDEYEESSSGFYVSVTGEINQTSINVNDKFVSQYDCRVTVQNSIMSDQYERWNNVFIAGENQSLLRPAQFNSVLYGDCPSKNKDFNECADLAYKSSFDSGNENCIEQKRKCMGNNVIRPNKTEELSRIRQEIESLESAKQELLLHRKEHGTPENLSWYDDQIQSIDSDLEKLREELQKVSAWPD